MKSRLSNAVMILLTIVLFASCKKDEKPPTAGKTIADIVNTDANFSLLKKALGRADMGAALASGSLTVFAPDNEAFTAAGINETSIDGLPVDKLKQILNYHVLSGKYVSSSFSDNRTFTTLSGINAKTTKKDNDIFINKIRIKTPDLIAVNGVIHVVEKLLMPPTITDIVLDNPNFSVLKAAVIKAGLGKALSEGLLTVFAPDNAAFAATNISESTIESLSVSAIDSILKYHVVGAIVPSGAVPVSDTVNTLLTTNLYASKNTNGVFVNGIRVKAADIKAANGVIHVVSEVLLPPTKTIAELVSADTSLSLLLAAVVKADLAGAVSGPGKFTVFAPTNDAFRAAGFPDAAAINAADSASLAPIVSAHVLGTNVFSSDLTQGAIVPTLQTGASLQVGLNPFSVKIVGSTGSPSNIILSGEDIIATNGVIHKIDKIILP